MVRGYRMVVLPDTHAGHHDQAVMVGPHVAAIIMSPDRVDEDWAIRIWDHRALHLPANAAGKLIAADSYEALEAWLDHHQQKAAA